MAEIWLAQYLCPSRHALTAMAYEPALHSATDIETLITELMRENGLTHICGLCGSTVLHFEHAKLPFTDWPTASAALRAAEVENIRSRLAFEDMRKSSS